MFWLNFCVCIVYTGVFFLVCFCFCVVFFRNSLLWDAPLFLMWKCFPGLICMLRISFIKRVVKRVVNMLYGCYVLIMLVVSALPSVYACLSPVTIITLLTVVLGSTCIFFRVMLPSFTVQYLAFPVFEST